MRREQPKSVPGLLGNRRLMLAAVSASTMLVVLCNASEAGTVGGDEAGSMGCYCLGTVGNVNCDWRDQITLADAALLIDHLYISEARLPNRDEANITGDPAGVIDIADAAMLIDHLFINHVELPLCPQPFNSPPETRILPFADYRPFVNSVEPHPAAAVVHLAWAAIGVRLRWAAEDIVDHPYDDPDFEFEYRLFGPYPDSLFDVLRDSFVVRVFRTHDGQMLKFDQPPDTVGWDTVWDTASGQIIAIYPVVLPTHYLSCDTIWQPDGVMEISCDTVLVDTLESANLYGWIDTLFDAENQAFVNSPDFYRVCVASSDGGEAWTDKTRDSLYNLFAFYPSDTTWEANFMFWVRSRDPADSTVYDPTPAFQELRVIDPKFERDILVMNWTAAPQENKALEDSVGAYWYRAIDTWAANNGLGEVVHFDPERDFDDIRHYVTNNRILGLALKYKTMIHVQDACVAGTWSSQGEPFLGVMTALSAGANAWIAARVPLGTFGHPNAPLNPIHASFEYQYFFGVETYDFPGWGSPLFDYFDGYGYGLPRVEDFIGGAPDDADHWSDIAIDTAFLHHRYKWDGWIPVIPPNYTDGFPFYPFLPEIGALPQVGWCQPTEDAGVLYRYVSLYGEDEHPYVPGRDFHGKPVMHRLDRGLFRTVHSNFTPLALEESSGQQMVDSVLNWLYEKWLPEQVSDKPTNTLGASNKWGTR